MSNLLAELKKYFAANSKEQILKDWRATEAFDDVGITIDEFLCKSEYRICCQNSDVNNINHKFSPEFSSGFFQLNNLLSHAK